MKILVTSGSTMSMIDKVRGITNIFSGRTGFSIAQEAACRKHSVTLLGNSIAKQWKMQGLAGSDMINIITYRTFDELESLMRQELGKGDWDACIHSAAVSDYKVDGVFKDRETVKGFINTMPDLKGIANPEGKIGSKLDELWFRLVPTPKLVDSIREWGLGDGKLVKFKLEVGVSPSELFDRASKSRTESAADIIVANRLDDFSEFAEPSMQIIEDNNYVTQVSRNVLPGKLLDILENSHKYQTK